MPLKLCERHGSPYWYIRGSIRGIRVDESTGVQAKADAEVILAQRQAEIVKRSIFGDAVSRTFSEAALSYLAEIGAHVPEVKALDRAWGRKAIGEVGQAEIDAFAQKHYRAASPATRNRRVYTPASAVLHHAARKGWRAKPVIARPEQPKGRVRWITPVEADRLIEAAAPHLKPLVIFLLCTGARLSEALYLEWRNVDLTAGHVAFLDTKNGENRGVPLHPRAVAALAALKYDRQGAVFRKPGRKVSAAEIAAGAKPSRREEAYASRKGLGGGQVKTAWAAMCKRAKITDFTPHDCRHTWATWHYAQNRNIGALMELGGWKSPDMVMRYSHTNSDHLRRTIVGLWGTDGESLPALSPHSEPTFAPRSGS